MCASGLRLLLAKLRLPAVAADVIAAVVYMLIADALGLLWYVFFANVSPAEAFAIMVLPFIAVDCIKAVVAIIAAGAVRKALGWH